MKVKRYIKPQAEIQQRTFIERVLDYQSPDHGDANESAFFDEEEVDDDYDPFFDD